MYRLSLFVYIDCTAELKLITIATKQLVEIRYFVVLAKKLPCYDHLISSGSRKNRAI